MRILAFIIIALAALTTYGQTTRPAMYIGVDKQPIDSFQKWLDRGVNLFVGAEPNDKPEKTAAWEDELERRGVWYMSYPSDDPARFAVQCKQKFRVAFMQDDEPDTNRYNANRSDYPLPKWGWTPPEVLAARYAKVRAASALPVFVNFAGPNVTPTGDAWKYPAYIRSADWLGHDWYVYNRGQIDIAYIGIAMDKLRSWSKVVDNTDRPQFAYIECSAQKLRGYPTGRAPTPDEMEAQINLAVSKGAVGFIYFPQQIDGGFQYDATPPDIQARMKAIGARLNPTTVPVDPIALRISALESALTQARADAARAQATADKAAATLEAMRVALTPTTRPSP